MHQRVLSVVDAHPPAGNLGKPSFACDPFYFQKFKFLECVVQSDFQVAPVAGRSGTVPDYETCQRQLTSVDALEVVAARPQPPRWLMEFAGRRTRRQR